MRIILSLEKRCIQTSLKREYSRSLSEYFKSESIELEEKIELLKTALESFDFAFLRSEYPELRSGSEADINIDQDGSEAFITVNGKRIETKKVSDEFP